MNDSEILDSPEKIKDPIYNVSRLVPYFVMWGGTLLLFLSEPFFIINFCIAIMSLLVLGLLLYSRRKYGIFLMGVLCLLATFNFVDFLPFEILLKLRLPGIYLSAHEYRIIGFDIIAAMFIMSGYIVANEDIFFEYFPRMRRNPKQEQQRQETSEGRVNQFMKKFERKSTQELENIAQNEDMVPEARQAARQLLVEKSKTSYFILQNKYFNSLN